MCGAAGGEARDRVGGNHKIADVGYSLTTSSVSGPRMPDFSDILLRYYDARPCKPDRRGTIHLLNLPVKNIVLSRHAVFDLARHEA